MRKLLESIWIPAFVTVSESIGDMRFQKNAGEDKMGSYFRRNEGVSVLPNLVRGIFQKGHLFRRIPV